MPFVVRANLVFSTLRDEADAQRGIRAVDVRAVRVSGTVDRLGRDDVHAGPRVTTFVLRDVPASICDQCGEAYFDEAVTERVLAQVEQAGAAGVELAGLHYRAA